MWIILTLLMFFLNHRPILASDRNIFGLHLTQISDIDTAAPLINSSGGDWGYATIVIRLDILDRHAWQEFMDKCRQKHIIPVIRLGTLMQNDYWKRPSFEEIQTLANFLNSLNWPTKTRYIIPFNEINHATEWGGEVDIKTFTDTFIYTSKLLKSYNSDFFILSTPLDLAAPENPPEYKSALNTFHEIYMYRPEYFDNFDGLASHSYPNHGYVGTPADTGRHSIRGYQWELSYLSSLGISSTYPVFITETGWPHREGEKPTNSYYTTKTASKFYLQALLAWTADPRIIAVTPFIYNFPHPPFDHFSWTDKTGQIYPEYQTIINSPKTVNTVSQITDYRISRYQLPWLIFPDREYTGTLTLTNTGQSIWGDQETKFCLNPDTSSNVTLDSLCLGNQQVLPGQSVELSYKYKINPAESQKSTYLGWQNLGRFELGIITGNPVIYQPKENILERLSRSIRSWFI